MESRPKARLHGVVAEELDDGLVVYDSVRNQAHSLNATAARVWRLADGTRTAAQIADGAALDAATAETTLARLQDENLLIEDPWLSRRKLLKRTAALGAGAIAAAPLIETVIIPTALAHASPSVTPHYSPPPGGPPMVMEQPAVVTTPKKPAKKKKKKKKPLTHRHKRHKPKRKPPSFTGAPDEH